MKTFLYEDEKLWIVFHFNVLNLYLLIVGHKYMIDKILSTWFYLHLNYRECCLSQQHILGPRLDQELCSVSQSLIWKIHEVMKEG